ncbi:MAG TPA: hypothetical protein DDY68_05355 [Porphyromonadaceae bacterium]|nr:hypothetical protein [Porphyromonadaceae bacterium]
MITPQNLQPFPMQFQENLLKMLGEKETSSLLNALTLPPITSLRINPFKTDTNTTLGENVKWCKEGHYVDSSQSFTFDPKFHSGAYYVQEASSMFLEQWVKTYVSSPSLCLDFCSAPGGKCTHLLSLLPKGSFVVANEPIASRASILVENLSKWGAPNVMITQSFPEEFEGIQPIFDVILTDVPCSGEGMFRKNTEAVQQWSMQNVHLCMERQRKILAQAWKLLKPNGVLIYSTCTFNCFENEEIMEWIVKEYGAEILPLSPEESWGMWHGIGEHSLGYHLFPHLVKGEGLYMCALRKPDVGNSSNPSFAPRRKTKSNSSNKEISLSEKDYFMGNGESMLRIERGDTAYWVKSQWKELYEYLSEHLKILQVGIPTSIRKGNLWILHPALALSTELNRGHFECIDLNLKDSLSYLRGESVPYDGNMSKGYVLITYRSFSLGWAKRVGNRLNNLYPPMWRIKSTHLPSEEIFPMLLYKE